MAYEASGGGRGWHEPTRSAADDSENRIAFPSIVFVGSCVVFSDRLLHVVRDEYPDIDVLRFTSIEQIRSLSAGRRSLVQVVVVDEVVARGLMHDHSALMTLNQAVLLALGYSSSDQALSIFEGMATAGIRLRCLPMRCPVDAWIAALRLIVLGEEFVPAEVLEKMDTMQPVDRTGVLQPLGEPEEAQGDQAHADAMERLTAREREILKLMSSGEPNKSIARHLGLSEHTIKLHVHHIFGKIGVRNRTGAGHWYLSRSRGVPGEQGL